MLNMKFDVLVIVHYDYDTEHTYYEVVSTGAASEESAVSVVRSHIKRFCQVNTRAIVSHRIVGAKPSGEYDQFVGKRVGQFVEAAKWLKPLCD